MEVLARMGYVAVATLKRARGIDDVLVFRKVKASRRLRIGQFTITYIDGGDRYVLNKYITNDNVDVITILPSREYPSRRQLSMINDEGKYVEIVVMPFIRGGLLGELASVASDVFDRVDRAVLSLGIRGISDVRNPHDVVHLMAMLTGDRGYWMRAIRENPMALITDAIYKRGVCM